MYKYFGAIMVELSFVMYGVYQCMKMKKRTASLKEFSTITQLLRTEIGLKNSPLPKAMLFIGNSYKNKCFIQCAENISSTGASEAFRASVFDNADLYCFNEDDVSAVSCLGTGLGMCDIHTQLRQIDYVISEIDKQLENAKLCFNNKCRIYISGSVLAGFFAVLMLV